MNNQHYILRTESLEELLAIGLQAEEMKKKQHEEFIKHGLGKDKQQKIAEYVDKLRKEEAEKINYLFREQRMTEHTTLSNARLAQHSFTRVLQNETPLLRGEIKYPGQQNFKLG